MKINSVKIQALPRLLTYGFVAKQAELLKTKLGSSSVVRACREVLLRVVAGVRVGTTTLDYYASRT